MIIVKYISDGDTTDVAVVCDFIDDKSFSEVVKDLRADYDQTITGRDRIEVLEVGESTQSKTIIPKHIVK